MNPIKQKIQELVPEVAEPKVVNGYHSLHRYVIENSITLAVVLRAIRQVAGEGIVVDMDGLFGTIIANGTDKTVVNWDDKNAVSWNLIEDDFDEQSPETQAFIGKLIGIIL